MTAADLAATGGVGLETNIERIGELIA